MKPQKNIPFPATITDQIMALKVGESLLFPYADGISARAIASRISKDLNRSFRSKREGSGIRLWRQKMETP
jgi:hypothetical protein